MVGWLKKSEYLESFYVCYYHKDLNNYSTTDDVSIAIVVSTDNLKAEMYMNQLVEFKLKNGYLAVLNTDSRREVNLYKLLSDNHIDLLKSKEI